MRRYTILTMTFLWFSSLSQDSVFINYDTKQGLPSSEIYDIAQDKWNRLWLCTDRGLCFYDGESFRDAPFNLKLQGKTPLKFFEDNNRNIWFTTIDNAIYKIEADELKILEFPLNSVLVDKSNIGQVAINQLYSNNSSLFIQFNGSFGYLKLDENGSIEDNLISMLHFKRDFKCKFPDDVPGANPEIQVAKGENGCFTYVSLLTDSLKRLKDHGYESFPIHSIPALYNFPVLLNYSTPRHGAVKFKNGNVYWFWRNYLFTINNSEKVRIRRFEHEGIEIKKIDSNYFCLSMLGDGVYFFNQDGREVDHLLPQLSVTAALLDHEKEIWFSTLEKGIFKTRNNGLEQIRLRNNQIKSSIQSEDNTKGKSIPYVKKNWKKKKVTYTLQIEKTKINGETFDLTDLIDLSYNQNDLRIEFKAISFDTENSLTYAYKMEGLDQAWNFTSNDFVSYPGMPTGNFNLMIKVASKKGTCLTKELNITIYPPFWKSWWFRSATFLLILGLLYVFFRFGVLTYNREILREILRQARKKIRREIHYVSFKENGQELKLRTDEIIYIQSSGNYLEIHTTKGKHVVREKIGNFLDLAPDKIEFLRVKRSNIIRIDKVTKKSKNSVMLGELEITVGKTYLKELDKILLD